jgi:7,8-dihydropterin-6-yl-methyl-4-(beta-D-ribofuranosyl)aminobenzene 5'-phosphate synthase
MRHSNRVDPIVKIGALTPPRDPITGNKHLRNSWVFPLVLLIFLHTPNIAWAEENYYQIINGTVEAVSEDFIKDSGYAVYFNYEGKKFLLDTGNNENTFVSNLNTAGISTDELDFVVLSHSHSDHTSGWPYLRRQRPQLPIYIPPGRVFSYSAKLNEVSDHLKISPNVYLFHTHDEAGTGGIKDELALLIITKMGPYLFTTNTHTDFFARLEKARLLAGQEVFFHSGSTARKKTRAEKITANARKMKALNVKQVSPSHSHPSHDNIFKEVFDTGYLSAIVGKKVPLEPATD